MHPTVILLITVTAEAKVTDIVVEHSASADFDAAAVEAVQDWVFEPATQGGEPVASRIRVAVHFEEPEVGVHDQTGAYAGVATATEVEEKKPEPDPAPAAVEKVVAKKVAAKKAPQKKTPAKKAAAKKVAAKKVAVKKAAAKKGARRAR